jgi:uncharacterized protein
MHSGANVSPSRADYVEFRAKIHGIVGLSNSRLDVLASCNGYHCTPVNVEVFADQ